MSARFICLVCGDAIGVYEPVLVRVDGQVRITSLAREPALGSANDLLVHVPCGSRLNSELCEASGGPTASMARVGPTPDTSG
jgi:hypothetical protein